MKMILLLSVIVYIVTACGEGDPRPIETANSIIEKLINVSCDQSPILVEQDDITEGGITFEPACYQITEPLSVPAGTTLTIMPGSILEFEENTNISTLGGVIIAKGTESSLITFRGKIQEKGFWQGVRFSRGDGQTSILDHVIIEDAGGQSYSSPSRRSASLMLVGNELRSSVPQDLLPANASITNSIIRNGDNVGIYIGKDVILDGFKNNTITGHSQHPITFLKPADIKWLDASSLLHGNDIGMVNIESKNLHDEEDAQIKSISIPYFLAQGLDVRTHLTIAPGVTLIFANGTEFLVSTHAAALTAIGTPDHHITLQSLDKLRGSWFGLRLHDTESISRKLPIVSEIRYVDISSGGQKLSRSPNTANLVLTASTGNQTRLKISYVILENSLGYGFQFERNTIPLSFDHSIITNNELAAGLLHSDNLQYLDASNDYTGNDIDQIKVSPVDIKPGINPENSQIWPKANVEYAFNNNLVVSGQLRIQPGTHLSFAPSKEIRIVGTTSQFIALGTADEKIIFSRTEDSVNGWGGIRFFNSGNLNNQLKHIIITYAGGGSHSFPKANILLSSGPLSGMPAIPSYVSISESEILNSANYGVWVADDSRADIDKETVFYSGNINEDYKKGF